MNITETAAVAKNASIKLAAVGSDTKNAALAEIAKSLKGSSEQIIAANQSDLAAAENDNLAAPLLKRLKFDETKIADVCAGIESLIKLPDPVGEVISGDALVQISTLCLKSGNAVLLKGGSEAVNTNRALAEVIAEASERAGMPQGWIQLLETRQDVAEMLSQDEHIDLLVPRGSNEFVRYIMDNTNIPVLGHADGICHVYVDGDADLDMAARVAVDSKCQYVAVCNAAETLLVDSKIAGKFLPMVKAGLDEKNVELRGCEKTAAIIDVKPATEKDWAAEYLDYILSIKIVDGLDEAIDHINRYGSGHTDAIVTANEDAAEKFMSLVDSGNVFHNCSTRFSDGFRYGLGAEVGISTNKIHARGPVGLEGLVIYKYKLRGNGQVVQDYSEPKAKPFTHKQIPSESNELAT